MNLRITAILLGAVATVFLLLFITGMISASSGKKARLKNICRDIPAPEPISVFPETSESLKASRHGILYRLSIAMESALYGAGIYTDAKKLASIWLIAVAAVTAILTVTGLPMYICAVCCLAVSFFPLLFVHRKKKKRAEKFEEQLADAIDVLCSAMRSGYSFQSALQSVCRHSEAPVSVEFENVFQEMLLGVPPEQSLASLSERIGSEDVRIFCTAVSVQLSAGGDLTGILSNIAGTIRQRSRIRREIKAKTSGSKISGILVGILPFAITGILALIAPDYLGDFLGTQTGRLITGAGLALMAAGFLMIRSIVNIRY